jgi:hypothetical protein
LVTQLRADGHSISALLITGVLTPQISQIAGTNDIQVLEKPAIYEELVAFVSKAKRHQ